jgi:hypothetical protein
VGEPDPPLGRKGNVPMKTRCYTTLCALCLAVLCLGSASVARAASVTGAATLSLAPGAPAVFTVSASGGPGAAQGTLSIVEGSTISIFGSVADLCVPADAPNEAIVGALITRSSDPRYVGRYFLLFVEENTATSDVVNFATNLSFVPCEDYLPALPVILAGGFPVTHGNLNVTP